MITPGHELEITRFQVWRTNHSAKLPPFPQVCTFVPLKGPFFVGGNRNLGLGLRSKESSGHHFDRPILTYNTTVRAELRYGNETTKARIKVVHVRTQSDNGNEAIKI